MIKCGHFSKNHNATLCFLIRNFSGFGEEDIELFEDLELKEEEIKFYTSVKNERQKASYSTKISFEKEDIEDLRLRTIEFITKIRLLIDNLNSENETL